MFNGVHEHKNLPVCSRSFVKVNSIKVVTAASEKPIPGFNHSKKDDPVSFRVS